MGDTTYKTHYAYDRDSRVTDITMAGTRGVSYTYDALGRLATRTASNGADYLTTYTYAAHPTDANRTTPLVKTIFQGNGDSQFKFAYTYDSRGNILTETRNDGATVTYTYDALGQLIQVDDPTDPSGGSSGTRWVYAYDLGGNITDKRYYARGTDTLMGHAAYSYDTTWKDKLIQYGTKALQYDDIGNPLNDGTWAYTWRAGRQLGRMVKASDGTSISYRYDHNGLRTHKIVTEGDTVTTWLYTLNGKQAAHLKVTTAVNGVTTETKNLHFYYDAQGRPGIVRVGTSSVYTYVYDLQGDVVGLLDATGAKVVEYHYDAWGRKLYTTGTLAETLGKLNPFRYRGYVYDEETGFYYLRSRYYNPRWGRFVNADSVCSGNSYIYGFSSPVTLVDADGTMPVGILNTISAGYNYGVLDARIVTGLCIGLNSTNIYLGFHEIAQVNAAKRMYDQGMDPVLEYSIPGTGEADIVANGYIWEVKPYQRSGKKQLDKYTAATGFSVGPDIGTIEGIPIIGSITMSITDNGKGTLNYHFSGKKTKEVHYIVSKNLSWSIGVAVIIVFATIAEDIASGGAGLLDDIPSFALAGGIVANALGI